MRFFRASNMGDEPRSVPRRSVPCRAVLVKRPQSARAGPAMARRPRRDAGHPASRTEGDRRRPGRQRAGWTRGSSCILSARRSTRGGIVRRWRLRILVPGLGLLLACAGASSGPSDETPLTGDADARTERDSGAFEATEDDSTDPACRPEPLAAAFSACRATDSEAACVAAGGEWGPVHLSPDPACRCPTGQEGCRCTRASDCLGRCMDHREAVSLTQPCSRDLDYRCTAYEPRNGCFCTVSETGETGVICAD